MKKRIVLTIEYDGTNYSGWQAQDNARSIQGEIEKAIAEVFHQNIRVFGAGRTDAGVHALGQCAHFDIDTDISGERFSYILNQKLDDDIRIRRSFETDESFHARKSAKGKHYRYVIYNARICNAIGRQYSWHVPYDIDISAMQEASGHFIGEHDFSAFRTVGSNIVGTVRTIYSLEVDKEGDYITIDVKGNGFLYNMVRIIAGTLIYVGEGKISPQDIDSIIASKDRTKSGITAPAKGLQLVEVLY